MPWELRLKCTSCQRAHEARFQEDASETRLVHALLASGLRDYTSPRPAHKLNHCSTHLASYFAQI